MNCMTARIVCVSMISVSGSITSIIVWGGPQKLINTDPWYFPCALSWLKTSLLLSRITKKKKDNKVMDFKETFFLDWMLELTLSFDFFCLNALLTKQQRELRVYGFLMLYCNFQWFIGFCGLFLIWMKILSIITQFWVINIDAFCLFIYSRVFYM